MIDWGFIFAREGGRVLSGYVPAAGSSGVTVADGVDLGTMGSRDFLALPEGLQALVGPYIGLVGNAARKALSARPLAISDADADALEGPKRTALIGGLTFHYQRDAGVSFAALPDAAQTVLASVTWQYGTTWRRCPDFWAVACKRDWGAVIDVLRDFKDDFPTRRKLEAKYLSDHLQSS